MFDWLSPLGARPHMAVRFIFWRKYEAPVTNCPSNGAP
jgi:hypothetical protein